MHYPIQALQILPGVEFALKPTLVKVIKKSFENNGKK